MVIAFLRVMHNLVLCHYENVEETQVVKDCIKEILKMFLFHNKQEVNISKLSGKILGLIVSIFCVMVES
jgi:hypothetical protein